VGAVFGIHPGQVGHAVVWLTGDASVQGGAQLPGIKVVELLLQGLGPLDEDGAIGVEPAAPPALRAVVLLKLVEFAAGKGYGVTELAGADGDGPQGGGRPQ